MQISLRQSRSMSLQLTGSGEPTKLPYCASGCTIVFADRTTYSGSYSRSVPHGESAVIGASQSWVATAWFRDFAGVCFFAFMGASAG